MNSITLYLSVYFSIILLLSGPLLGLCSCPDNTWIQHDGSCYKSFAEPKTFESSQQQCQSNNSELVTIDTREENIFLASNVLGNQNLKFWIGLQDKTGDKNFTSYQWMSNLEYLDSALYQNWQYDNPVEAEYRCVYFTTLGWYNYPCSSKLPFICEPDNSSCDHHWENISNVCFIVVNQSLTFEDANIYCSNYHNGRLMAVDSYAKQTVIQSHIQPLSQDRYWIGIQQLYYQSNDFNYYWLFSQKSTKDSGYTFWSSSSPYDYKLRCVRVLSSSYSNTWANYPCSYTYQSVCEMHIGAGSSCPTYWKAFNSSICLQYILDYLKFGEARSYCNSLNASLVVIDSQDKQDFVGNLIGGPSVRTYWIGLVDIRGDNSVTSFQWYSTDKTLAETGYSNWEDNYPTSYKEQCVYLLAGKWNNVVCGIPLSFVCELSMYLIFCKISLYRFHEVFGRRLILRIQSRLKAKVYLSYSL
ncbi:uncharacterized protein TRIADDRAFT_56585 [Trichoplax adhaerens]|uniref:C-type lectin domain-containing protein n=1 Tax=Trichoplax adhaerens TaxID=10228 RepID=B3RYK0_TRIAD|nr:hypothetical protein TRIADDRAFT_56585 [Trichoplax adhaerens]EDV24611.1 hypothetical protein TRIADDRAFT_56585 [Trichoplax adhaerens]|eukprot:XP_002112501.1 hypothetical protein TRIADDRAFT_56585 [Trichoplax adhaerens]